MKQLEKTRVIQRNTNQGQEKEMINVTGRMSLRHDGELQKERVVDNNKERTRK